MLESNHRLGVALGSSFLGFPTHLGFLAELVRNGWVPDTISGSSTGSVVAGLYASGASLEAMEELFTRRDLSRYFFEWQMPYRALGTLLGIPGCPAVFTGNKLGDLLRELAGDKRIEDCTTAKLHIALTSLHKQRVELCAQGPLVETILASCAMPGVIAPRRIGGNLVWDGGLACSVPVEAFVDNEAITHIATHSILFEDQSPARQSPRFNLVGAMFAASQLSADELLRWKLELAHRSGKTVAAGETVTPRPRLGLPLTLPPPKPWPDHARDLMGYGAATARRVMAELGV